MEELLQQILQECRPYTGQGALASYIPELARQDPDRLGIAVFDKDGNMVEAGDSRRCFTIQSVMKPLLLLLALQDNGRETVRAHVGVEATGKPFDAINVADNALLAKHLNPMVNAGAILMCQLVGGETYDQGFARLLGFIRRLAANEKIDLDEEVYHSEKATGSKNRALAYLLKAHGLLHGVERHLTAGAGGHVALDRQQARQLLFQRRRRLGVGVVEHRHPVARLPEGAGRRGSDAPVAARDQHAAPVGRRDCRFRHRLHRRFRFRGRFCFRCRFRRSFLHRLRGPGCLVLIAQVKSQFKFIIVQESALLPFVLCLQKIPQAGRSRPPPHPWAALCSSFRSRPVLRRARWSVRVVSTSYH